MSNELVSVQKAILELRTQLAELRGLIGSNPADPAGVAAMVKGNIDSMNSKLDTAIAAVVASQNALANRMNQLELNQLQLDEKLKTYFIKDRYAITRSTILDIINSEDEIKERLKNG